MKNLPTLEQIKTYLDKSYSLIHIDYRDNLDECLDKVEEAFKKGIEHIEMNIDDWYIEIQFEGVKYAVEELRNNLSSDYNDEYVDAIMEEYEDYIRDEIYNRSDDNVLKDLLRNTQDPVVGYSFNNYIANSFCGGDIKEEIKNVKKALGIKIKDKSHDDAIREMIDCCYGGGELMIFFNMDLREFLTYEICNKNPYTHIKFSGDVCIAIVNYSEGSGFDISLPIEITVPFDKNMFVFDKTIKYSYTYSVCGMSSDWCKSTNVELLKKKGRKPQLSTEKTAIDIHKEKEERYNKTYKEGKCTPGDMDISRHRNTTYINNFPCGTKCVDCGNFWID